MSRETNLERFAIACTVGADLRVCPELGMHTTTGADLCVCPELGMHTTTGADLCVCPELGMHTTTGADTQVCPYTDLQTALEMPSASKNHRLAGRMTPSAVAESSTFLTGKTRGAKVGARILSRLLGLFRRHRRLSQAAEQGGNITLSGSWRFRGGLFDKYEGRIVVSGRLGPNLRY